MSCSRKSFIGVGYTNCSTEYKKVKSSDIIGTLVSLFETKDVFVKEFQNVIGEQLLKSGTSSEKEVGKLLYPIVLSRS